MPTPNCGSWGCPWTDSTIRWRLQSNPQPTISQARERERCDRQQWRNSREARTWTKSRTDRQVHGHFQNLTRVAWVPRMIYHTPINFKLITKILVLPKTLSVLQKVNFVSASSMYASNWVLFNNDFILFISGSFRIEHCRTSIILCRCEDRESKAAQANDHQLNGRATQVTKNKGINKTWHAHANEVRTMTR